MTWDRWRGKICSGFQIVFFYMTQIVKITPSFHKEMCYKSVERGLHEELSKFTVTDRRLHIYKSEMARSAEARVGLKQKA